MDSKYIENYEYVTLGEGERQYDDIDLSEVRRVDARYIDTETDRGNPFIEALPRPRNRAELRIACNRGIEGFCQRKEIEKPVNLQMQMITKLRQVRYQLPMNIMLEECCYNALVMSYRLRHLYLDDDIFLPITTHNTEQYSHGMLTGNPADAANAGFSLIGYSGCGKSSALHTLFLNYPQVIMHHGHGLAVYPQIVYLVVNCPAHSNVKALYQNIGAAIDRALGNIKPVYEDVFKVKQSTTLGQLNCKLRDLIELFGIGIIVLDEIQNLNFNSSLENSVESLLFLSNETKVAFGVVGTEDARKRIFGGEDYDELLPDVDVTKRRRRRSSRENDDNILDGQGSKLRASRRIGPEILASAYCTDRDIFDPVVKDLFHYQWFETPQPPTPEIIDALYDCTKGIIDQLIGIYMFMQLDYVRKTSKKPVINAQYVYDTAKRHYPGMQAILANNNPEIEEELRKMKMEAEEQIAHITADADAQNASLAIKNQMKEDDTSGIAAMRNEAAQAILMLMGDKYNLATINGAIDKVLMSSAGKTIGSSQQLARLANAKLEKMHTDQRPHAKKDPIAEKDIRISDYLQQHKPEDDHLL